MRRAYKYRAYVNKETETNAKAWLRFCQRLYNKALEQRINRYEEIKKAKENLNKTEEPKRLTKSNQYTLLVKGNTEYKDINSQCLDNVLIRLNEAYKHFFRRVREKKEKAGHPKFAPWDRYNSFTLTQSGWKLDGRNLQIRNVGRFRLKLHRPIQGDIKTVTVKKEVNQWYAIFSCDNVPSQVLPSTGKAVGIDVGLTPFITDTDENTIDFPRHFRQAEKELRVKQRKLARCKKGSKRRKKVKLQVTKCHQRIANRRKDFIYNVVADYVGKYDLIAVEDLTIKGMVHNKYLSKSIYDASWNLLLSQMKNKAEASGRQFVAVDPKGTTQLCSRCGNKVTKGLSVRVHNCKKCGLIIDRDLNAAINILGRAIPSDAKFWIDRDLSEKHAV